jgi:hypothetical protein
MAERDQRLANGNAYIRVPTPDPTALTTEQLLRAISALREVIETRLDGMDKGIVLLQTTTDKMPAFIGHEINGLKTLHEEKFSSVQLQFDGIQKQFLERDTRTEQGNVASTTAINAALQAAKEAVGQNNIAFAQATQKSENTTTKQIDDLQVLFQTGTKATDEKIEDLKDRQARTEAALLAQVAAKAERKENVTTQQGSNTLILALVVGVSGVILGIAAVVISLFKAGGLF